MKSKASEFGKAGALRDVYTQRPDQLSFGAKRQANEDHYCQKDFFQSVTSFHPPNDTQNQSAGQTHVNKESEARSIRCKMHLIKKNKKRLSLRNKRDDEDIGKL
jgi:hypothetical protein